VKGKKRVVQNFDICGETQIELDSEVNTLGIQSCEDGQMGAKDISAYSTKMHHDAATTIQACWRARTIRRRVAEEIDKRRLHNSVAMIQQQMVHIVQENTVLRQALAEESRRRMIQEEALRSLWGEVQHLQTWAEQVSDGQDASFDMSQVQSLRGSPAAQAVLQGQPTSPVQLNSSQDSDRHQFNTSHQHRPGDSVTYF